MKYAKRLYVLEKERQQIEKWLRNIKRNKLQLFLYALVWNEKACQVEILHTSLFLQKWYPKEGLKIIGLAKSHEEALELLEDLLRDIYQDRGDYSLFEFFAEKDSKEKESWYMDLF